MAAQRQFQPKPQPPVRPALRLVQPATTELTGPVAVGPAFQKGLLWGLAVSALGFWMPVGTALYLWLR